MKRLLLLIALAPLACFAQHFEVGINGGFDFHSVPIGNYIAQQDKAAIGLAGSASIDLLLPNAQIGIGAGFAQLSGTNYIAPNYTIRVHDHYANPLVTPYAFYNFLWNNDHGYAYAGFMAGLAVAKVGVNTFDYQGTNVTGYSTTYNTAIGFAAGLQAGFLMSVSKKVGIGGEAALRYADFTYDAPNGSSANNPYKYRIFYFPITVGIRYKMGA